MRTLANFLWMPRGSFVSTCRNPLSHRGLTRTSIAVALDARSDWMQRAMERWGWLLIALGLIGLGVTIAMVVKMPA